MRRVSQTTRTTRWPVLAALRAAVLAREHGRCQARYFGACRGPLDCHHVVRRSRGGLDHADNLALLCRAHHQETDWPYSRGRLLIDALGRGRFHITRLWASDKWALR